MLDVTLALGDGDGDGGLGDAIGDELTLGALEHGDELGALVEFLLGDEGADGLGDLLGGLDLGLGGGDFLVLARLLEHGGDGVLGLGKLVEGKTGKNGSIEHIEPLKIYGS